MHSLRLFIILSLSLVSFTLPTAPDSDLLLANAKQAQELNTQFKDLKSTDECKTGDEACIDGSKATCVDDKWEIEECPQKGGKLECFVLPSVRREGTITACTSDKIADALISALGADGGAFGSGGNTGDNNNDEENNEQDNKKEGNEGEYGGDNEGDNEDSESEDEIITFPPSDKDGDTTTVDVTMTAPANAGVTQATISLVPLTRTLTPEDANKIVAGAGGAAAAAPTPPAGGNGNGAGAQGGQKTIILTNSAGKAAPTPAVKGAVDQSNGSKTITLVSNATPAPEAAAAQAPAAAPPAPEAESSSPMGGYGGGYY